jgi:hypothetical protein
MPQQDKHSNIKTFALGFIAGSALTIILVGLKLYKDEHPGLGEALKRQLSGLLHTQLSFQKQIVEDFRQPVEAVSGKSFGRSNQLTFELFRNGTFAIDGSGEAKQKSESYRDSAFIRSTEALPKTYKITVVAGEIDYNLDKIEKLPKDPEYPEGPQNENGCYLLSITDEKPTGHHTNIWWHQHRKLVIDVDNNTWGHGMPNPVFMVYFDRANTLVSYDGIADEWQREWKKAVTYEPAKWYKIEVEKTKTQFILRIFDNKGKLLKQGRVDLKDIWHEDEFHSDYFVVGDPHENYYQGSMKIKSIAVTPGR